MRREGYISRTVLNPTPIWLQGSLQFVPIRPELKFGACTDVAGGSSESIFRAMADAISVSKLRWRLVDSSLKPVTVEEAFYLGTLEEAHFWKGGQLSGRL